MPRLTDILYWTTVTALVLLPVAVLGSAFVRGLSPSVLAEAFPGISIAPDLGFGPRLAAFGVGVLPAIALFWTLWQVRALFALFRSGAALTLPAAARLRAIGTGLVVTAATALVCRTVQILLLTAANPAGERVLSISFSSSDFGFLLAGGLMLSIGHIMADAARIAEENEGFV